MIHGSAIINLKRNLGVKYLSADTWRIDEFIRGYLT